MVSSVSNAMKTKTAPRFTTCIAAFALVALILASPASANHNFGHKIENHYDKARDMTPLPPASTLGGNPIGNPIGNAGDALWRALTGFDFAKGLCPPLDGPVCGVCTDPIYSGSDDDLIPGQDGGNPPFSLAVYAGTWPYVAEELGWGSPPPVGTGVRYGIADGCPGEGA